MRCLCLSVIAAALAAVFSGCSGDGISATASYNPGYGPFDKNGNYVEAWADKPARKQRWARSSAPKPADPKPTRAKKEFPLVAANTPRSAPPRLSPAPVARPRPQPARPALVRPNTRPVSLPRAAPTPPPVAYSPPPPRPKPKPVARPKPKPAPKPVVRHKVAKGDTLYSLSRRYGTSVSAIQRANGISGSTIRLGQSLKIPK